MTEITEQQEQDNAASVSEDSAVANLKAQLAEQEKRAKAAQETADAERRQREDAVRRAHEYEQAAQAARTEAQSHEAQVVQQAIDGWTVEEGAAEAAYQVAMEAGDYKAAAGAQKRLARAAAELSGLQRDKAMFDARKERPPQPAQQRQPQLSQGQIMEAWLSQFSPRAQQFIRSHMDQVAYADHPSGVKVPVLSDQAMALHHLAKAKGMAEDSDEYYKFIATELAPPSPAVRDENPPEPDVSAEQDVDEPPPVPIAPKRMAPVAAPVSRSPASSKTNPRQIKLTPAQVEAAKISGISEAKYAEQLATIEIEKAKEARRSSH